jgi:eukaryotic-like serine/threonine-protein kinase
MSRPGPSAERPDRLAAALSDRYRIERALGEGGMATVYLAEDLKHDRDVAIKVLKPELAAVLGAERFVQEIRTTAHLQHPNILPLFDSGRAVAPSGGGRAAGGDTFLYYVMPYIDGESLRSKLDRERQLGVEEAVRITAEVAEALDYAHRHGVVHRDIKPENILLHDGRPMVADFGIALAVSAAAGGRMTETGLSLGTPHYMSPEQATAEKTITGRSDIYSLGAVLYEMLTGDPPHTGSSAQQIIAKIVTEEPGPVTKLRRSVPANVVAAVATSLEKLPADRFESAKAFAEALRDPHFIGTGKGSAPARERRARRLAGALAAVAAIAVVAIALAVWGWHRPAPPRPVARYAITLGGFLSNVRQRARLGNAGFAFLAAISPDGSAIAYADTLDGQSLLFVKRRQELAGRALTGTEGALGPFFSPDGVWLGFFQRGELRKIPSAGGEAATVADHAFPTIPASAAWLDDGTIVFTDASGNLRRVGDEGGAAVVVARLPQPLEFPLHLSPLPGARGVLFTACSLFCASSAVEVWDARRDTVRQAVGGADAAWYSPTGHLLYAMADGRLLAAPWDEKTLRVTGPAVPILDGMSRSGFLLSRSGTALYVMSPPSSGTGLTPDAEVVWVDRTGRVAPVDSTWRFRTGNLGGLALSPDGRRLAIGLQTDLGDDIYIKRLPNGPASRLTFYPGEDALPQWAPDGRDVTFASGRTVPGQPTRGTGLFYAVWYRAADGSGEPALLAPATQSFTKGFWSPDARWLILQSGPGTRHVLVMRPGTDSVPRPLLAATPAQEEWSPALSPDSRWLAYVSNQTGTDEVFVSPFPDANRGKWQISSGGGSAPLWAHHGHELFYWARDRMIAVDIDPGPPVSVGRRRVLFTRPARIRMAAAGGRMQMDISPDDQRFIMVRDVAGADTAAAPQLVLVENFFEELRATLRK